MTFEISLTASSVVQAAFVLTGIAVLLSLDIRSRLKHKKHHYLFAAILGTLLSVPIVQLGSILLIQGSALGSAVVGLGVLLLIILWRLLFNAWEAPIKATVLGSCILWLSLHMLWHDTPEQRLAHLLTIVVALIPAIVWASLFLKYHRERLGTVLLMFFAGILSTAPILFYDALWRRRLELHFFLFRIVPEDFQSAVDEFVQQWFGTISVTGSGLLSLFISFLVIGLMEEASKYWVLHKTGKNIFMSIDDVMQMGIIVAIGFAFAENVLNQGYFLGFVNEYLQSNIVNWSGFIGNVAGRSVLTSMVHIVSTGVLGYYLGLALYASQYLKDIEGAGHKAYVSSAIERLLYIPKRDAFRAQMMLTGITMATLLHTMANFLVSVPKALPGNPRTLGDLVGAPPESLLHAVALLLIPSLLYVGGGFWLLSFLFLRKENIRERGRIISVDTFVTRKVME